MIYVVDVIQIKISYIIMYNIIAYLFFISLFSCIFSTNHFYNTISLHIALFFTIKFLLDYTNCTFGYIECKIRNVDKHHGFINNLCKANYNLLNTNDGHLIFILLNLFIIIQFIKNFYFLN